MCVRARDGQNGREYVEERLRPRERVMHANIPSIIVFMWRLKIVLENRMLYLDTSGEFTQLKPVAALTKAYPRMRELDACVSEKSPDKFFESATHRTHQFIESGEYICGSFTYTCK